jgi:hypothetical protein
MTGANFSSWYNAQQGSFYADYITTANSFGIFNLGSGSYASAPSLNVFANTSNGFVFYQPESYPDVTFTLTRTLTGKIAFGYSHVGAGSFAAVVNGGTASTATGVYSSGGINGLRIGTREFGGGEFLNGCIRKLAYYPARATNAELQSLTVI